MKYLDCMQMLIMFEIIDIGMNHYNIIIMIISNENEEVSVKLQEQAF